MDESWTYYRRNLKTAGARKYYDGLVRHLEAHLDQKTVSLPRNGGNSAQEMKDIGDAMDAVVADRPDFFTLGSWTMSVGEQTKVTVNSPYTSEEIRRIRPILEHKLKQLISGTAGMSTLAKEQLLYQRIIDSIQYQGDMNGHEYNIVGPLLYHAGVCASIAAMLTLVFRKAGIPCIKVSGKLQDGGLHAWNIAWINGVPCHLDATHDSRHSGNIPYFYFNLSDEEMLWNRTIRSKGVPRCPSSRMEYHRVQGTYFRTENEAAKYVAEGLRRKIPAIRIRTDASARADMDHCIKRAMELCVQAGSGCSLSYVVSKDRRSMLVMSKAG